MAYRLDLNENFSIYRSRYTGQIGFWERNVAYDYYAARCYLADGEKLTVRKLIEWAEIAKVDPKDAIDRYVAMICEGGRGMIPDPTFSLEINV